MDTWSIFDMYLGYIGLNCPAHFLLNNSNNNSTTTTSNDDSSTTDTTYNTTNNDRMKCWNGG